MAPHSSTLAWKIPWMEEPARLLSMGSLRIEHDWETSFSLFAFMHWRKKWQPTPVFLPGESQGWGAWWAAVYGVAQSWKRLKWLGSSSSLQNTLLNSTGSDNGRDARWREPCSLNLRERRNLATGHLGDCEIASGLVKYTFVYFSVHNS